MVRAIPVIACERAGLLADELIEDRIVRAILVIARDAMQWVR
jgi:hypothetical protein